MALGAVALIAFLVLFGRKRRTPPPSAALPKSRPERKKPKHTSPESVRKELYDALRHLGITKPAGKTSSELKTALTARNVDDAAAQALVGLLQQVEQAMYTPGKTSAERLKELERNAAGVVASLSKHA
jgi:tRNA C32,U32 (ribose-2'-O)-methylase TrmJ